MSTETAPETEDPTIPPTAPSSVVWCCGRPYVLEAGRVRSRWVGTDDRGRPETLSTTQLQRRGWSHRRVGSRRRAG
ncbi:hypothetical protein [Amycolatopsis jejuensis]|uniref:hypothetical protein n=1 Tax=Amycolatopsis jejuensis TaxID=330084 RepID=UPI0005245EB1|nr:hypothetical protein [Amycolatopsis jejuensis]